ncbi:FadR/GntR family transcriptional regulator [Enterococcus sp. LJL99]
MEEGKTLVGVTTDKLIQFIKDCNFTIGDKLPNEYELSKQLDVGRSTIREAVRALASRNILEVRQGAGTFVSERRGIATDPLGFSMVKDQDQMIRDLFELRYLLEPKMAALAARYATEQQIMKLEELREAIEQSFFNGDEEHIQLDIAFHTTIAEASGNVALFHLMPVINQSIALFNKDYSSKQIKTETVQLHRDIVDAVMRRRETEAMDAMLIHMANNRREVERAIREK